MYNDMFELSALGQEMIVICVLCIVFIFIITFLLGMICDFEVE